MLSTLGFIGDLEETPRPASAQNISYAAKEWMFFDETGGGDARSTAFLHYPGDPDRPGNTSGVTLGPGYDMGYQKNIANDLVRIGVDPRIASQVEREAKGLTKRDAQQYAEKNGIEGTRLIRLTREQQIDLQSVYLPRYEAVLRAHLSTPILQREYEALVSFTTNPGGTIVPVINALARGEVASALKQILNRVPPVGSGIRKGLQNRRGREVQWFIAARYTR